MNVIAYVWCMFVFGAFGEEILSTATTTVAEERSCSQKKVDFTQCNRNEACSFTDNGAAVCKCRKDFERKEDGSCQPIPSPTPPPTASASKASSGGFGLTLMLWLMIPVVVSGAIGVLIYTGRQKMWLNRFYRMRVRSYNNVLVSSQDEDDPPIA